MKIKKNFLFILHLFLIFFYFSFTFIFGLVIALGFSHSREIYYYFIIPLLFILVYFVWGIVALKKCNLNNKWFLSSFILDILVIVIPILGFVFDPFFPDTSGGFVILPIPSPFLSTTLFAAPFLLIASFILFIIGYFKNRLP